MDVKMIEERYMKTIKRSAMLSGIWPEQGTLSKYIMRIITYIIGATAIVTQMARVICFFSVNTLIEEFCFLCATVGIFIKQINYIVKDAEYKELIEGIRNDWSSDRPKEERDIMIKYAERGDLFTSIYLANCYICCIFFLQMPLTPRILDILLPKNVSRDHPYVYPAYYAIDEHKYYLLIIAHMTSVIIVVSYVFIACDTSFMYMVQHACGLLAISGHRFKTAVGDLPTALQKETIKRDEIYRRVCRSIQGHQHALKYLKNIQDTHDTYLFICVGIVMVCFSVTLVKISNMDICLELAKDCTFSIVQLVHILYLAIQGQLVADANDEMIDSIYEALWYNSDRKTQLLFVLALRNCLSPPRLTAGGLITLNLESFSEIIKASVSYFTVLQSK